MVDLSTPPPADDRPFQDRFPLADFEKALRQRRTEAFLLRFASVFHAFRYNRHIVFRDGEQDYFTRLFSLYFELLARPGAEASQGVWQTLFLLNAVITNLLAVTPHKNGDDCLQKTLGQPGGLVKTLLLYTPRSCLRFDVKAIFDADAGLASFWYSSLFNWSDTYAHPVVYDNFRYFLHSFDDRFIAVDANLVIAYFRCTYIDPDRDLEFKRRLNRAIRQYCQAVRVHNRPRKGSLAVVSAFWFEGHVVHRAFAHQIEALKEEFDLSLIHCSGAEVHKPDTSLFRRVYHVAANTERVDLGTVLDNDFEFVYYPDVGTSPESLYLSNMRLAPIQAVGTGHPVSTAGSMIDYFITGAEETTPDHPEANYDERLVLLPGLAWRPIRPDYRPSFPTPDARPAPCLVNCSWARMKINHPLLETLGKIRARAKRNIVFQFFPGCVSPRNGSHMATMQDLVAVLGQDAVICHGNMAYADYMAHQDRGHFTLHSWHFGGGTTAVDALILGKPIVVREGRHEYNRFSAALLRRVGLGELVTDSEDGYIELGVRLADDDAWREDLTRRIREADLDKTVFREEDTTALLRTFRMLRERHAELAASSDRSPVFVE